MFSDLQDPATLFIWNTAFKTVLDQEVRSFDDVTRAVAPRDLLPFVTKNLKTTSEGVLACIKTTGKRVCWPLGEIKPGKPEKPKMVTNAHLSAQGYLYKYSTQFVKPSKGANHQ